MDEPLTEHVPLHFVPDADDEICHTCRYPGALTLCGMQLADSRPLHDGEYVDGVCTGCGRKGCVTCEIMEHIG
jgi:hypothetical protein